MISCHSFSSFSLLLFSSILLFLCLSLSSVLALNGEKESENKNQESNRLKQKFSFDNQFNRHNHDSFDWKENYDDDDYSEDEDDDDNEENKGGSGKNDVIREQKKDKGKDGKSEGKEKEESELFERVDWTPSIEVVDGLGKNTQHVVLSTASGIRKNVEEDIRKNYKQRLSHLNAELKNLTNDIAGLTKEVGVLSDDVLEKVEVATSARKVSDVKAAEIAAQKRSISDVDEILIYKEKIVTQFREEEKLLRVELNRNLAKLTAASERVAKLKKKAIVLDSDYDEVKQWLSRLERRESEASLFQLKASENLKIASDTASRIPNRQEQVANK